MPTYLTYPPIQPHPGKCIIQLGRFVLMRFGYIEIVHFIHNSFLKQILKKCTFITYYYRVLEHDSVTFLDLIQMTDVVIQHPKEIIPSDHQQLLSEVETICR